MLYSSFFWIFKGIFVVTLLFVNDSYAAADYTLKHEKKVIPRLKQKQSENRKNDEEESPGIESSLDSSIDFSDEEKPEDDETEENESDEGADESISFDQILIMPNW